MHVIYIININYNKRHLRMFMTNPVRESGRNENSNENSNETSSFATVHSTYVTS